MAGQRFLHRLLANTTVGRSVLLALFELLRGIWKHDSTNILYQVGYPVSYFAAAHNHRLRDLRERLTNLLGSLLTTTTAASPLTLISEKRACCALDTVLGGTDNNRDVI